DDHLVDALLLRRSALRTSRPAGLRQRADRGGRLRARVPPRRCATPRVGRAALQHPPLDGDAAWRALRRPRGARAPRTGHRKLLLPASTSGIARHTPGFSPRAGHVSPHALPASADTEIAGAELALIRGVLSLIGAC